MRGHENLGQLEEILSICCEIYVLRKKTLLHLKHPILIFFSRIPYRMQEGLGLLIT